MCRMSNAREERFRENCARTAALNEKAKLNDEMFNFATYIQYHTYMICRERTTEVFQHFKEKLSYLHCSSFTAGVLAFRFLTMLQIPNGYSISNKIL